MTTKNVIAEELHVGTEGVFAGAGFTEVAHPTPRRVVMRIDFGISPSLPPRDDVAMPDPPLRGACDRR